MVAGNRGGIAIVTGGGSGIGAAAAIALAGEGWTVGVVGRRPEALAATVTAGRTAGLPGSIFPYPADVTNEDQIRELFDHFHRDHGRVDLLFNNAGMGAPAVDMDELPVATWREVVEVNLTGSFLCTREAFRIMRRQDPRGGRIINNGSVSAHAPRPLTIAYTATKHAITGLTKSTALDGRPYDIACGQIDIGNAATDMGHRVAHGALQADGDIREEPLMDVEEVGRAIRYMASLPLEHNVQFMTVMATKMPFVGRG
ncbi:MAG TPA: SDR family oxidoreductase [Thermomicrobiales bacterium]|nr:SDR family oxidoreductase [Thermomicrobiales bacterium]